MTRTFSKESGLPLMWAGFVLRFREKDKPVTVQLIAEKGYYLSVNSYEDRIYRAACWLMRQVVIGKYPLEYARLNYVGNTGATVLFAAPVEDYTPMIAISVGWDESDGKSRISLDVVRDDKRFLR